MLRRLLLAVVPVVTATIACGSPENTNPSGSGDAGPPIDGMQACIDLCVMSFTACSRPTDDCVPSCERDFRNAGPECQDEINAEQACALDATAPVIDTLPCPTPWPQECGTLTNKKFDCIWQFGCYPTAFCPQ